MKLIKRYKFFTITLLILIALFFVNHEMGVKAVGITVYSLKEMVLVIPPVFILLGLLDNWVPKETMVKYMGEDSGIKGVVLALFIGSAAAGPLYGAFPVAAVFMKKGVKFSNVIVFLGAWSTTKIPMFLFEMASLGSKFAFSRLVIDIFGIIIMARIVSNLIPEDEIKKIYINAENLI
ncbi:permease [uncultured Ilyobacter sp.]|uniref:permease n=1 Tax=uncultured Ilyobacter sp. TaxID=544433 RepID=UPI0029BFD17A|nr:permease [uncultured Ilyobacter sp.]